MFTKISRVLSALLIAGILLGSASFPTGVRADSIITVTTTDDELNSDGDCSLREAIQAANRNSAVDACIAGSGADTINFADNYTITLGNQLPAVTSTITIIGNGAVNTIIQANAAPNTATYRVFEVKLGGDLALIDITVQHGQCNGSCTGESDRGGGIYTDMYSSLTITNSTISGNVAEKGGGIFNDNSSVVISNSTLSNNLARSGGGIYAMNISYTNVVNSIFSDNSAILGGGGGIYINSQDGRLDVTSSTFFGNSATHSGGGIFNDGRVVVMDSTFSGNTSDYGGGIANARVLSVVKSTFVNNSAGQWGGGLYDAYKSKAVTVVNSTFSSNSAEQGGGIYANGNINSVINSTFSGNVANQGDGIYNVSTLTLNNSILANTTSGVDCYNFGGTVSGNNNLIETDSSEYSCGTTAPIHSDPNLGALANNGGPTQTFALLAGSPAIDSGDDAICAAAPVNNTSQNGVTRPQGAQCDIGSFETPVTSPYTFRSVGANDGWILESTEISGVGGTMNVNGQAIVLGDDAADKQFRSILHFNTASLPDDAVITKVTLKIKKKAVVGTDPFTTHQYIKVDIKSGSFSNNPALQLTDFKSTASKNWVGTIKNTPVDNWYSVFLNSLAYPYVSLSGVTQFRLYFRIDDDNDNLADYMQFFSGNAAAADRPQLIVEYYTP